MRTEQAKAQVAAFPTDPEKPCRLWTGTITGHGYAAVSVGGRTVYVHRLVLEAKLGRPIKHRHVAMHVCDVRNCVEPSHLVEGTYSDNSLDAVRKGRRVPRRIVGEANGMAALDADAVRTIRSSARSHQSLARDLGVSEATVRRVRKGMTWSHVQ